MAAVWVTVACSIISLFRTFEEIACPSTINEKKTKYLKNTKKETRNEIEQVQHYKYLGSTLNVSN